MLLRVTRSRGRVAAARGEGTAITRGAEPQLRMTMVTAAMRGVRDKRLRVAKGRGYAYEERRLRVGSQ